MRPVILLAAIAQPCSTLFLGIPPSATVLPTCEAPAHLEVAALSRASAVCDATNIAWVSGTGHPTVQEAIDASLDGEAVLICPGTHTVGVDILGRSIELSSVSGSATDTILQGGGGRILTSEGSAVTVSDLTLTRSETRNGGAILSTGGSLLLSGVTMTDNIGNHNGGAVSFTGGVFTVRGSDFENNWADYGGGAIQVSEAACVSVIDSTFTNNEAGYEGGALSVGAWGKSTLAVVDSTFTGNYADYAGGALAIGGWDHIQTGVSGSTFAGNIADYEGGAIHSGGQGATTLVVEDSMFLANIAAHEGGGIQIGGWEADVLAVRRSTFDSNQGGGILVGGWEDQAAELVDVDLLNNQGGGAVFAGVHGASVDVTIQGGTVAGNTRGGLAHRDGGFLQGVDVDFGPAANTPDDVVSECGNYSLGLSASFTCSGLWSTP